MVIVALLATAALAGPLSAPTSFIYCSATSVSPRGPGLIITAVFKSRSDPQFVKSVFANYLRRSYAPYGNGWIFQDGSATCTGFDELKSANDRRRNDIARIPQPSQTIFNVTFVMQ